MKKGRFVFIFLIMAVFFANAQDSESVLNRYIENFKNANLETKYQILKSAEEYASSGGENMGPLYETAISYVVSNEDQLRTNATMRDIALFTIEKIRDTAHTEAVDELYRLFVEEEETSIRIAILNAIETAGQGNAQTIAYLNSWLSAKNNSFQAGTTPNLQVLEAAVIALGELGDSSSFSVILTAMLSRYSESITEAAREALFSLEGDFVPLARDYIQKASTEELEKAVDFFFESQRFSQEQRVDLAETVLSRAVLKRTPSIAEQAELRGIRKKAASVLERNMESEATDLIIAHFNMTINEYEKGFATRNDVLEAIAALGAMGTDEAAERLSEYLDVLNNYTENIRPYDSQIVLAVVSNLQRLDKMVAYNSLLYASFLDYPDRVKSAIKTALNELAN